MVALNECRLGINHLDGEERAGCFVWFIFLVSRGCCLALVSSVVFDFGIS